MGAVADWIVKRAAQKIWQDFEKDPEGTMSKWWPSIVSALTAVAAVFVPALGNVIASHPKVSGVLAVMWAIINHLIPSPTAQQR